MAIQTCCELTSLTPEQLEELILKDKETNLIYREDGQDINRPITDIQECLNNLIDARKRLINIGFYNGKRQTREPEVQIKPREPLSSPLEENGYPDSDPGDVPPYTEMEI